MNRFLPETKVSIGFNDANVTLYGRSAQVVEAICIATILVLGAIAIGKALN